jgi:hypothetical protein
MAEGKYTIELCPPGGGRAGVEGIIASDDDLTTAARSQEHLPIRQLRC